MVRLWHPLKNSIRKVRDLGVLRGGRGEVRTLGTVTRTHP